MGLLKEGEFTFPKCILDFTNAVVFVKNIFGKFSVSHACSESNELQNQFRENLNIPLPKFHFFGSLGKCPARIWSRLSRIMLQQV